MLKYVKDDKQRRIAQCGSTPTQNAEDFEWVGDDDVISAAKAYAMAMLEQSEQGFKENYALLKKLSEM